MSIDRIEELAARFQVETIRDGRDRLDLRYGVYYRGTGEPRRYVLFLNGRTEWLEKYVYLPEDLGLPADTAFVSWDHRGQGGSGGARAYVDSYDSYAEDASRIVQRVVGDKPYVALSHSMGGLIALYATLTGRLKPEALVLSSPLLGLPNAPVPRSVARPLARLLTLCQLGTVSSGAGSFDTIPFEKNALTHDGDLYARMQRSPYKLPGATFGWVAASFKALDTCFSPASLQRLTTPTLVLGGSKDTVVDLAALPAWVQKASRFAKVDVQLCMVPGARHELLSETRDYYDVALAAIRGWLASFLKDERADATR